MNYFVNWVDNVLSNPYQYVDEVLKNPFQDFKDGDKTFKNIQMRENNQDIDVDQWIEFREKLKSWQTFGIK